MDEKRIKALEEKIEVLQDQIHAVISLALASIKGAKTESQTAKFLRSITSSSDFPFVFYLSVYATALEEKKPFRKPKNEDDPS